jgi:sulfonate transport system ATP-binding protein
MLPTACVHDQTTISAPHIALKLRHVARQFGPVRVLHALDLDVHAGDFVAIIGRSGCGKSTLLRIIAGLDQPTSGTIERADQTEHTRLMFQEPRLLPWAKVVANVAVGLHGYDVADPLLRSREALAQVGLSDKAHEWPSVLSGGQKQRVALARALVSRPRILALDEPLGALDALTRLDMQYLIERVWQEQKFTAILVTHDVSEALRLADRVIMIDKGRIGLDVAIDVPRERRRGSVDIARLEEHILHYLLRDHVSEPEYVI